MINNRPKNFTVDPEACIACGTCVKVCPTHVLKLEDKIPFMLDLTGLDYWNTCWECQRCLAVCPKAAISVCGKKPENSFAGENMPTKDQMKALIANRRSIRHFKEEQVDKALIDELLRAVGNLPTGGNEQLVMFSVLDEIEETRKYKDLVYQEFSDKIEQGIAHHRFDVAFMKEILAMRQDGDEPIFRGAPHLVIPHAKIGRGEWVFDTAIAFTYLELLMTSRAWHHHPVLSKKYFGNLS